MCLIVDNCVAHKYLTQPNEVRNWLDADVGSPRLVIGGGLRRELVQNARVQEYLLQLSQNGKLRSFSDSKVDARAQELRAMGLCVSNDQDVLALAAISGARTLATDDGNLMTDFRNPRILDQSSQGRIYSTPKINRSSAGAVGARPKRHRHLLSHTPSCGLKSK